MESSKRLKVAVIVLGIALLVSLGVMAWVLWQNYIWRTTVDSVAEQAGGAWAQTCFRNGKLVVYEYSVGVGETNGMPVFSGRRHGPFDVWLWPDYAELPMQSRYAQRKVMEAFDSEMRDMYKHRKFYRQESGATNKTVNNDNK